jgi:hypothetical protein
MPAAGVNLPLINHNAVVKTYIPMGDPNTFVLKTVTEISVKELSKVL